jgi:hypothetical protein
MNGAAGAHVARRDAQPRHRSQARGPRLLLQVGLAVEVIFLSPCLFYMDTH